MTSLLPHNRDLSSVLLTHHCLFNAMIAGSDQTPNPIRGFVAGTGSSPQTLAKTLTK